MVTDSNQVTEETVERTRRRVAKMSRRELLDWAGVAVPGMMRHLEAYARTGDEAHLTELCFAEMQFAIVLQQLMAGRQGEGLTPAYESSNL